MAQGLEGLHSRDNKRGIVQAGDSSYSVYEGTAIKFASLSAKCRTPHSFVMTQIPQDTNHFLAYLPLIFCRPYHFLFDDMCSLRLLPMMEYLYTHAFFTQQARVAEPSMSSHAVNTDAGQNSRESAPSENHAEDGDGKNTNCENEERDSLELEFIDDYFDIGYRQYETLEGGEDKPDA
ncbi:MAG: hypothetical protein Q9216_000423 [Gyalolechia sp. 2 TL-2023]